MSRRELAAVGAVACVACCAGPILGVLGGVGPLGLASTLFVGVAGVVIAIALGAAIVIRRQQRARSHVAHSEPVAVTLSKRPSGQGRAR